VRAARREAIKPRLVRAAGLTCGVALACGLGPAPRVARAAPPKRPPHAEAHPTPPLAPLPMLPSVARVKVVIQGAQIIVTEEVNLPRGDWHGESLDFYVAFGAPGAPRAVDAHLVPVADGSLEPEDATAGEALSTDRAPRRPATVHPLLGRDTMAGIVAHVPRESLERALAPGNMAALRLRTVLDVPEDDPQGGKSLVVRLGASRGTPLTLGRIVLSGKGIARAEARLCGADADEHPLAIGMTPKPSGAAIAPVLAVRHATDDLCVRYWSS
jgi:hypothetical protein